MIDRIRKKLDRLREADPDSRLVSTYGQCYGLRPPLSSEYLADIENDLGVKLPTSYRRFLTELGNGGVGPDFGIYSIEESLKIPSYGYWTHEPIEYGIPEILESRKAFPLKANEDGIFESKLEYLSGILNICEIGCGYFYLMVIRGDKPGTIWWDGEGWMQSQQTDFLKWYENWLDNYIDRAEKKDFVRSLDSPHDHYDPYLEYSDNPRRNLPGSDPETQNTGEVDVPF